MRKMLQRLLGKKTTEIPHLTLCPHHPITDPHSTPTLPYSTDHCQVCHTHLCHVCSEQHVAQHCRVSRTFLLTKWASTPISGTELNGPSTSARSSDSKSRD